MQSGTLYIVATPIGNLEDITLRAIRILKEVDAVLCEDTRTTGKLLAHLGIKQKLVSYHSNATAAKHGHIIRMLEEGKSLALVSDAGTPSISDPGVILIREVLKALPEASVVTIPGASAIIAALSVSGMTGNAYTFMGFAPHKKGRKTFFEEVARSTRIVAFYESPHRFAKTLVALAEVLEPERQIVIARELTKLHEQTLRGTLYEIIAYFKEHPDKIRGEFVILVEGLG